MTQAVIIKSKPYGIHLVLNPDMEYNELVEEVIRKFQEADAFFKNASVGISFEGYALTREQMYGLIDAITSRTSIRILCIMEAEQIQEACMIADTEAYINTRIMENAMIHNGSLKAGERMHSETGVVVLGDVERGAKVTAKGNIIVFGALEGFAQAGQHGDSAAYIAALSINTEHLQIGNILYIPQEKKGGHSGFLRKKKKEELSPQIARVHNRHVIMESLRPVQNG